MVSFDKNIKLLYALLYTKIYFLYTLFWSTDNFFTYTLEHFAYGFQPLAKMYLSNLILITINMKLIVIIFSTRWATVLQNYWV